MIARLTRYDPLPSLQLPESINEGSWNQAILITRRRLALDEVFQ